MATPSMKTLCSTDDCKTTGVFRCEGCTYSFCSKHIIDHRNALNCELDEIISKYDVLQQTMKDDDNDRNSLHHIIEQIDEWRKESIQIIEQTADKIRNQAFKIIKTRKESISKKLVIVSEELRTAQQNDDYIETDLHKWTRVLEKLENDFVDNLLSSITFVPNPTDILINKICLITDERLNEFVGNVLIEDNGRTAIYNGETFSSSYVRGINEYSFGQHVIEFVITKKSSQLVMSFDIVSKFVDILEIWSHSTYYAYGWQSDDTVNNPDPTVVTTTDFRDLRDETNFEIELFIDCDNENIKYVNKRTKVAREMKIDTEKCPFPWQLQFFLYAVDDRVQILSSRQLI